MENDPHPNTRGGGRFGFAERSLSLVALCSIAVAQPLYDIVGRQAQFLVAHQAGPRDLALVIFTLSAALPAALVLALLLARRGSQTLARQVHLVMNAVLATLLAVLILKRIFRPSNEAWGLVQVCVAAAAGIAFSYLYESRAGIRLYVSILAISAVLVPATFLARGPIRQLAFPDGTEPDRDTALEVKGDELVVMIVFDELPLASLLLPDGRIARDRFPAFARLADRSHWFRNATAIADRTEYALPPIIAGIYPSPGFVMSSADYPDSVFTLLGGSFDIRAIETISQFCPPRICEREENSASVRTLASDLGVIYAHLVVPETLKSQLPGISMSWKGFAKPPEQHQGSASSSERTADHVAASFARFLTTLGQSNRPAFHFLHVLAPHTPWIYLPSGKEYEASDIPEPDGMVNLVWGSDRWLGLQGYQRHLLQLGYVDRFLNEALDRLEDLQLLDSALVIVTADHGASFHPGEHYRRVTPNNVGELLPVPLFFKLPGQEKGSGVVDDSNAETLDVLPTLAGLLGAIPNWTVQGRNLFDPSSVEKDHKLVLNADSGHAIRLPKTLPQPFEAAGRLAAAFGTDHASILGIGTHQQLLLRQVAELPISPASGPRLELHQPLQYENVNLEGRFLPAWILGVLTLAESASADDAIDEPAEKLDLAIAINGQICATTRSSHTHDPLRHRFSAMVPESCIQNGSNQVDVFVIEERDGEPYLSKARQENRRSFSLLEDSLVVSPVGVAGTFEIPIVPGAIRGAVWAAGVGVAGWAVAAQTGEPVEQILGFRGDQLIFATPPTFVVPALSGESGAGVRAGFKAVVPDSVMVDPERARLRILAFSGGVASPIALLRDDSRASLALLRQRAKQGNDE